MAKVQELDYALLKDLISTDGLYILGYSWLFGMSVWISFFGGIIALKTLPRHQFGTLQHKTFPIYFVQSMAISAALLSVWVFKHPDVLTHIRQPKVADVAQAYALASVLLSQGFNYFVIGPMTSSVMFQRKKQEKDEGKLYTDPEVSSEMKALNRQFGILHGISSLANLGAIISLAFHGLWLGTAGVGGY